MNIKKILFFTIILLLQHNFIMADDIVGFYQKLHRMKLITDVELSNVVGRKNIGVVQRLDEEEKALKSRTRARNKARYPRLKLTQNKDGSYSAKTKDFLNKKLIHCSITPNLKSVST